VQTANGPKMKQPPEPGLKGSAITSPQEDLFVELDQKKLLDTLLDESRLYKAGKDYKELLDFVIKFRKYAPYNAMLLNIQKPGLTYATSAQEWREKFERSLKPGARPLIILWPFGPVAFVYDVQDTEGKALPLDALSFVSRGDIDSKAISSLTSKLDRKNIKTVWIDAGDAVAGSISHVKMESIDQAASYDLRLNTNHKPSVQFSTIAHELGHLYLGHLGADTKLEIRDRRGSDKGRREIEAESVAYLVTGRYGVETRSHPYLAEFVSRDTAIVDLQLYEILRAAGHVEKLLGIADRVKIERRARRHVQQNE